MDKNPTLMISHLNVGAVMVADDLIVVSRTSSGMQQALNVAEQDASMERYCVNTDKTNIMNKVASTISKPIASNINKSIAPSNAESIALNFIMNGKEIGISEKEAHLGIQHSQKNNNIVTAEERIKTARAAAYTLMGAGTHGYNGMGTEIALQEYLTCDSYPSLWPESTGTGRE